MKTVTILLINLLFITPAFCQEKTIDEAKGLEVGSMAPLFKAVDADNKVIDLKDYINEGPVVLIFYRGVWCPFCNRHLSAIQEELPKLYEKGAKVIAITPERPEYIDEMAKKTGAEFTILFDESYSIAKAYDVNFALEQKTKNKYNKFLKANLEDAHANEEANLPIPATYIIGQDGKIVWRHFDPNHKKRSTVEEILMHIPN